MSTAKIFSVVQRVVKLVLLSLIFIILLILGIIRTPIFGSFAAKIAEISVNKMDDASLEIGNLRFSGFLTVQVDGLNLQHPSIEVDAGFVEASVSLYSLLLKRSLVVTNVNVKEAKVEAFASDDNDYDEEVNEEEEIFTGFDPSLIHLSVRQIDITNTIFILNHESINLDVNVQKLLGNFNKGSFLSNNMPGGNIFIEGADVSVIIKEGKEKSSKPPAQFLLTIDPVRINLNSSRFYLNIPETGFELESTIGHINLNTQSLRIVDGVDVDELRIVDTHTSLNLPKQLDSINMQDDQQNDTETNFNINLGTGVLENVSYTMGNLKTVNSFDPANFNAEIINGTINESEVNIKPFFVKSNIEDFFVNINKTKNVENLKTSFFMDEDVIEVDGFFMETEKSKFDFDAKANLDFSNIDSIIATLNFREVVVHKNDAVFFADNIFEEVDFEEMDFNTVSFDLLADVNSGLFERVNLRVKIDDFFNFNVAGNAAYKNETISFNSEIDLFSRKKLFEVVDGALNTHLSQSVPDSLKFEGVVRGNSDSIYTESKISVNQKTYIDFSGFASQFDNIEKLQSNVNIKDAAINVGDIYDLADVKEGRLDLRDETVSIKGNFISHNGKYNASVDISSSFLNTKGIDAVYIAENEKTAMQVSANIASITANGETLTSIMPQGMLPEWLKLPKEIETSVWFEYSNDNLASNLTINTTSGNIVGDFSVKGVESSYKEIAANLKCEELNLDYITSSKAKIDRTNFTLAAQMGVKDSVIDFWQADLDIAQTYISNMKHNLVFKGSGNDSLYKLNVLGKGDYISADIDTEIRKTQEVISANIEKLKIIADLNKLGIQDSGDFLVESDINGSFYHKLDNKNSKVDISLNKLNAKIKDIEINLDESEMQFNNSIATGTSLIWESEFLNLMLNSSKGFDKTATALRIIAKESMPFFVLEEIEKSIKDSVDMPDLEFKLTLNQLQNIFNVNGELLNFDASIHSKTSNNSTLLSAKVSKIEYDEIEADSITIKMDYNYLEQANLSINTYNLSALDMLDGNIKVQSQIKNKLGKLSVSIEDDDSFEERFFASIWIEKDFNEIDSLLIIKPATQNFVLNSSHWLADTLGFVKIGSESIIEADLTLGSDNKRLAVKRLDNIESNPLIIEAQNFQLNDVFASLGAGGYLAANLSGFIRLYELRQGIPLFTAGLEIEEIVYKEDSLGNLSVAAGRDNQLYSGNARLEGEKAVLDLFFVSDMDVSSTDVRGNLNIEKIDLSKFENYFEDIDAKGFLTGKLSFSNNNSTPNVEGEILFDGIEFNYEPTKTGLTIDKQKIFLNQSGVELESFTVKDIEGNAFVLNGTAQLNSFTEPIQLNINGTADDFILMNSTRRDNPDFWGKVILTSDLRITGDHNLPVVSGRIKLDQGSVFNMDLQAQKRAVNQRQRILLFKEEYEELATQYDTTEVKERGLILNVETEIDRNTQMVLHIDAVSGDMLAVEGTGNLNISYDQGGTLNITGAYEINRGMYSMNIYGVINRTFVIKEGSQIVWMGGPADAQADITAAYNLRASPEGIIEQKAYPIPFSVNLNMQGNISEPDFTFFLDMPISERNAYNGAVYSAITAINADENQLNMQVLSLLIAGRFSGEYMASSQQTTQETVAIEAGRSAGRILTQELNRIAGQYITGADVSFDFENYGYVDSEGQMQSRSEINVEVQRQFFDNRVSVMVGERIQFDETEETDYSGFTGDVVIEYKLTPDGKYRFSGYRRNEYGNLIDRNVAKTGFKFIFDYSYD